MRENIISFTRITTKLAFIVLFVLLGAPDQTMHYVN